ncbi:MAG: hypothetical protein Q4G49_04350 [Paracoccus sp. (in: a-proteobacteria)]|nr:hypothetical protein [Paracoccus sp. (in: a-proteobacteria)]
MTGGTVTVGRSGLDAAANGVAAVNLVGRFVVIDGKVTAVDSINVQAGPQGWDATRNRSTGALSPSAGGTTRDFGVDATAFGGMEAGRITIVGNETGFGVRSSGALSADTGGISVTAKDDVTVRSAAASGAVAFSSSEKTATIERDVSSSADKVTVPEVHISGSPTARRHKPALIPSSSTRATICWPTIF